MKMKRGEIPKEDLYPNSTQFPNILLDEVWPLLRPQEAMVLAVAVRKTFGWQQRADIISLSQFCEATGLGRRTVQKALDALKVVNLLIDLGWQTEERLVKMGLRPKRKKVSVEKVAKAYILNVWEELDHGPIDMEMLWKRKEEQQRLNRKRTEKGRKAAKKKVSLSHSLKAVEQTKSVGQTGDKSVAQPNLKSVAQPSQNLYKPKKHMGDKKRHHPDHQQLMALYREAIREDEGKKEGKELTAVGKENKAAQKILQMGFAPEEAMECYRYFKKDMFWRDKHLSLAYIAEHIGAWKEGKGEANRRIPGKPGVSQAQRDYYAAHLGG